MDYTVSEKITSDCIMILQLSPPSNCCLLTASLHLTVHFFFHLTLCTDGAVIRKHCVTLITCIIVNTRNLSESANICQG